MFFHALIARTRLRLTFGSGKFVRAATVSLPARRANLKRSKPPRNLAPRLMLGLAGIIVSLSTAAALGQATIQGLGDLPGGAVSSSANGVSADGATVVGWSSSASGIEAFRWTGVGGMVGLGDLSGGDFNSEAFGTSADGVVVVGRSNSASGLEAFRWTAGGGMVGLGDLPGGDFLSEASATSADGAFVVGSSRSAESAGTFEAFRWTASGGMVGLGDLPGNGFQSKAFGTSADGAVVVGFSFSASGKEAFRWTSAGGMAGLGDLAGAGFSSIAFGTSPDGAVVVGRGNSDSGDEAFRWTSGGGMVGLGELPGGGFQRIATATSADGSVVVGFSILEGSVAFLWTAEDGMRLLPELLVTDFGLDLAGWTLERASGISADGLTIVGSGVNAGGFVEGWIVTLPTPVCGNAIVEGDEECDDGNDFDGDSCLSTCEVNPNPVPTVSQWGLVGMAMLVLTAGTLVYRYRWSSGITA